MVLLKKNRKLRVCINFIDLNKTCLKDSFLLPHIDQMLDATVGHELLSFLYAFLEYNQILMHPDDEEKTLKGLVNQVLPNILINSDKLKCCNVSYIFGIL